MEYIQQITDGNGWYAILCAVPLVFLVVTNLDKFGDAVIGLKDKVLDRPRNRILDSALKGDKELREEIFRQFENSDKVHERIDGDIAQIKRMLDNDKRAIDRHDRAITAMRNRMDGHEGRLDRHDIQLAAHSEETRILISSVQVLLGKEVGLAGPTDIVDTVKHINEFLVERKDVAE